MTRFETYFLRQTFAGSEKNRLCKMVALKKRCFSLADDDVLWLSRMHVTAFFIDDVL